MKAGWFLGNKRGKETTNKSSYFKIVCRFVSEVKLNYDSVQHIIALKQKLNCFKFWGNQLIISTSDFTNYVL